MNSTVKQVLCTSVATGMLTACVTNPDGSKRLDDRATGALLGAVAGCAIASATDDNCAKGAAIGAAAGFLLGWYFESKKIADAKEINRMYEVNHVKIPQKEVKPAAFMSRIETSPPGDDGSREIQVTSNTDLIGYGDKVPVVEQKYALYDEKNKLLDSKSEKLASVDGAGRYQTKSKFKVPNGKNYRVETTLVADNKTYKKNSYMVSSIEGHPVLVASLSE
jgi:hypothetical protein